jgi:hypothetical protein
MEKRNNRRAVGLCGAAAMILLLVICLNNAGSVKWLSLCLMCATLVAGLLRLRHMGRQLNLPVVMLTLITTMGGISVFYALSGKFALQGFLYLMTALCACLLLTMVPEKSATPGRFMATALAGGASLIGLLSIDHVSTRLLSAPALWLFSRFTTVFDDVAGVEAQVRLTSIFDAPNVFAGCVGIGLLLSLMLAVSAPSRKERRLHLVMLYVNALAFALSFSMGATVSIAAAIVCYLLLERRTDRCGLAITLGLTLITVAVGLVPASMIALNGWNGFQPLPLLCAGAGAAALCAADRYFGERLTGLLRKKGRRTAALGGVFAAALAAFLVTACLWTGTSVLSEGETLRRAVYPREGSYTVTATGSGDMSVTIESQNRQEAMMRTATVLYSGKLEDAVFTVPEDALVVYFNFCAGSDSTLENVSFTGASGSGAVPLEYRLLPDFIANRIQGLFANQNAIQRLVFFSDGWKLFGQNPLFGQGIGSFESAVFGVQSFYYETKYVHNHYIQTLLETGIVGLLLFAGLLILSAVSILRFRKKQDRHPFLPALGALLVFMAVHGAVEVVFSSGYYLPLAFGVFALIGVCCPGPAISGKLRNGLAAALGAMLILFAALLGCNLRAAQIGQNATTMRDFHRAARLDPFEWTDYAISYIVNAPRQTSQEVQLQAEAYVQKLDNERSNSIHYYLARYCFETGQMERGMEMAQKQAKATISSSGNWNELFLLIYEYDDRSEEFNAGVRDLVAVLEEWNEDNMGQIRLDDAVASYVDGVLARE